MEASDFESSEYDLGTTSVELIRAGNVVQGVLGKKLNAAFYYAETAVRFKKTEEKLGH